MAIERFYLTDQGADLLAKAQIGKLLQFTRVQIGEGALPNGTVISSVTSLISPLKYLPISKKFSASQQVTTQLQFSNSGIGREFWWMEVGLFATDPDKGEILYAYGNAYNTTTADKIPATLTEFTFNMIMPIGNATNVTAIIDESLIYPTILEMKQAVSVKGITSGSGTNLTATVDLPQINDGQSLTLKLTNDMFAGSALAVNGGAAYPLYTADGNPVTAEAKAGSYLHVTLNTSQGRWYITGGSGTKTIMDALNAHTNNANIHVTAAQKDAWTASITADIDCGTF